MGFFGYVGKVVGKTLRMAGGTAERAGDVADKAVDSAGKIAGKAAQKAGDAADHAMGTPSGCWDGHGPAGGDSNDGPDSRP